ncbi:MAG: HpdG [Gammaproteobacteria bacterium]|nr:HpdG [Gammaproteobacteria bacterium]
MSANPFDHLFLRGMDIDLHLLTKGNREGPPVIFLPGISSYSKSFEHMLRLMPDEWYCLALDIRGRGQSGWPKHGYRLENYANDLLNVVNALIDNPVSPVLVGHSMGARIAAAFASRYSSLLSGMVLIDPPINGPGQRPRYPFPVTMYLEQKAAVEENRMDAFRELLPAFDETKILERADEYRNVSKEAIIESYDSMVREPFQAYVKAADCPILLLAAENGDTIRDCELATLTAINPRLRAEKVLGVGHMIHKDAPQRTADYITAFVKSVCPQAATAS